MDKSNNVGIITGVALAGDRSILSLLVAFANGSRMGKKASWDVAPSSLGEATDAHRCNHDNVVNQTTPVDAYPAGRVPMVAMMPTARQCQDGFCVPGL